MRIGSDFWRCLPVRLAAALLGLILVLVVVGCDSTEDVNQLDATPVPPTPTISIVQASPTVAPVAPTPTIAEGQDFSAMEFTPGAPPVSIDNPAVTVTPTPAPTQAAFPAEFVADDGLVIAGTFYPGPIRPAPTALLIHMRGSTKEAWQPVANALQKAGYSVLAIDLRGYGDTGGTINWTLAPQDVKMVLARLSGLPGVDPQRIVVVGADIGANLALGACADLSGCKAAVLLSPGLDTEGVQTTDAMKRFGTRPVLIVASRSDTPSVSDSVTLARLAQGEQQLQLYDGKAHGTALFSTQPGLAALIVQWLSGHNK
jgi:acetyl esterase/lipase